MEVRFAKHEAAGGQDGPSCDTEEMIHSSALRRRRVADVASLAAGAVLAGACFACGYGLTVPAPGLAVLGGLLASAAVAAYLRARVRSEHWREVWHWDRRARDLLTRLGARPGGVLTRLRGRFDLALPAADGSSLVLVASRRRADRRVVDEIAHQVAWASTVLDRRCTGILVFVEERRLLQSRDGLVVVSPDRLAEVLVTDRGVRIPRHREPVRRATGS
jgi:hypothetical protein